MTFFEINYSLGASTVLVKVDVVFISVKYFQHSFFSPNAQIIYLFQSLTTQYSWDQFQDYPSLR